jgi:thiamine-phosphate pyrophosphorylase
MPFPAMGADFKLYAITDRRSLPGGMGALMDFIESAANAGLDMIQVREKDLPDRGLLELVGRAVELVAGTGSRVLVNDRLDIALAAGAHGVHLGGHSAPPGEVRAIAPEGFLIGVSTHNMKELDAAVEGGADFVTFGPVFKTLSKAQYGPPVGIDALERACSESAVPVFPLGGISRDNYSELLRLPVAGLSAISLFQSAVGLPDLLAEIKQRAQGVR